MLRFSAGIGLLFTEHPGPGTTLAYAHGMKRILATMLLIAPAMACGQPVLEFRNDLAFSASEIDAQAAQEFGVRLRALARAGELDRDPALELRLHRIIGR